MVFLFGVFTAIAYLLSNTRLFLPLALVAIGTITTTYVGIFKPGEIGWGSTYTFDGILLATLVMVFLDTYLWPSPLEPKLLESVAADLATTRKRLALIGQRYLDPSLAPLPSPIAKSRLAPSLALLNSVKEHAKPSSQRFAALLQAVITTEHTYLEVERLAVLADEAVADELRRSHGEAIVNALGVLDAAFAEQIDHTLAGLSEVEETARWAADLRETIRHLARMSAHTLSTTDQPIAPAGLNFLGFLDGLEAVGSLLEPREPEPDPAPLDASEADGGVEASPFVDSARLRFGIKLGATVTLGLLVGLTTQRADLQTILWSIAVAGQPNQYGAVIRKTILRLTGCIIGGLAALAAMIVVSQNFDSLPPYLVAIFVVTWFSAYVAQSSEWLSYAGIQAGITFLICYVGLGPSSNIYEPLWRFWGIVLGLLTTGFVFLFLWPEYARDKVIDTLAKLIGTTLAFANDVAERSITDGRISVIERRLSNDLLEVLNMADHAKLEGPVGRANSKAAVEAAALLVRVAYRFQTIARVRMTGLEMALPEDLRQHCAALERGYCSSLESSLEKLRSVEPFEELTVQEVPAESSEQNLSDAELLSRAMTRDADGTTYAHADWTTQLEAYRRMPILLSLLDSVFSNIAIH
jgi:uncharacterized membrane protein YccC